MAVAPAFSGFRAEDFAVFAIDGFAERMEALRGRLRPRLVALAEELSPRLTASLGATFHPHVAAHMRRTVNPPPETWAAFGPDPRRYKALAHFALGIDAEGVWLRLVLKDEALADRQALSRLLADDPALTAALGRDLRVWRPAGARTAAAEADDDERARLMRRADAQWSIGRTLPRDDRRLAAADALEGIALDTFGALAPLWRRLPSSPWNA